jgi:hypothetical protein
MDLDIYLDGLQEQFNAEEKVKSSVYPDLERAPGKNDNWVEKAGGLPKYIERIAKHLHYEKGMDIGHAIAVAVNTVKRWAAGGGGVTAKTKAKAAAAVAEWEKKKASKGYDAFLEYETKTRDGLVTVEEQFGMEYKNVGVKGLRVADEVTGIVEAIVSVTGVKDEVNDVIKPGAYAKTLMKRTPKGVYSHAWDQPISKTLEIKELLPGDPSLPSTLADGKPWPKEAGALWVKMQFNLDTERGRTAFSDVKFFGNEQEWSIGYNVPVGGAKMNVKSAQREIDYLDLFEYSPVLFGAMPMAATQSVKSAQNAFKAIHGKWSEPADTSDLEVIGDDDDDLEGKGLDEGSEELADMYANFDEAFDGGDTEAKAWSPRARAAALLARRAHQHRTHHEGQEHHEGSWDTRDHTHRHVADHLDAAAEAVKKGDHATAADQLRHAANRVPNKHNREEFHRMADHHAARAKKKGQRVKPGYPVTYRHEKSLEGQPVEDGNDVEVLELDEDGLEDIDDDDEYEPLDVEEIGPAIKALLGPEDIALMVKSVEAINGLLAMATGFKVKQKGPVGGASQVPGDDTADEDEADDSLAAAAEDIDDSLVEPATALDEALGTEDAEGAANDLLDVVEDLMDGADAEGRKTLAAFAKQVADALEAKTLESSADEGKDIEPTNEPTVKFDLSELDGLKSLLGPTS